MHKKSLLGVEIELEIEVQCFCIPAACFCNLPRSAQSFISFCISQHVIETVLWLIFVLHICVDVFDLIYTIVYFILRHILPCCRRWSLKSLRQDNCFQCWKYYLCQQMIIIITIDHRYHRHHHHHHRSSLSSPSSSSSSSSSSLSSWWLQLSQNFPLCCFTPRAAAEYVHLHRHRHHCHCHRNIIMYVVIIIIASWSLSFIFIIYLKS